MEIRPKRLLPPILAASFFVSLLTTAATAFDNPLSPEAIRDAYFLGSGDTAKRAEFLKPYTHQFPIPTNGPQIATIEIETPFASVVDEIALHGPNLRAPDVQQKYFGKPIQFRVRVQMSFTATYPSAPFNTAQLGKFWNDFHIRLKQGTEIPAISQVGTPLYSDRNPSGYYGASIVADYSADKVQSGPATVVVTGPDDARTETMFDLASLR
jgi:hypothetical protein